MKVWSMVLFLLFGFGVAHAHDGHDHGDAPSPVTGGIAPRFEARSDLFELVGVLQGDDVVIYLDRAADNAPVMQAGIEIESGAFKGEAVPGNAGEFRLKAGPLAQPGKHPLTITVSAGDDADLLTATLDTVFPESVAVKSSFSNPMAYAVAVAVLLLGLLLASRLKQRKHA